MHGCLQFSSSIESLQASNRFLSVHHWSNLVTILGKKTWQTHNEHKEEGGKHVYSFIKCDKNENMSQSKREEVKKLGGEEKMWFLFTLIQGCESAFSAVMRLSGFIVNIPSMSLFTSSVTESHSGLRYCRSKRETTRKHELKMNSYHILPIIFNVVQLMEDNYERSDIIVPLPLSHQFLIWLLVL